MIRRPPRSTLDRSSAASDVYKRQGVGILCDVGAWYRGSVDVGHGSAGASGGIGDGYCCLLYTSPSPRDRTRSRMPSSA